jgi:uncharacterized protein (DUF2249 family)
MEQCMAQAASNVVDLRAIAPPERHPLVFSTFRGLAPGEAMVLMNDRDPRLLYHQFTAEIPGGFTWQYLEQGPQAWRVAITRNRAAPKGDACCGGGCSGA